MKRESRFSHHSRIASMEADNTVCLRNTSKWGVFAYKYGSKEYEIDCFMMCVKL